MRIAIPVEDGALAQHFGHAGQFHFFLAVPDEGRVEFEKALPAPPHEPGRLPEWLWENGAKVVIAGGIGPRAVALLEAHGIEVFTGAPCGEPHAVAEQYLAGTLAADQNRCDHGSHGGGCRPWRVDVTGTSSLHPTG